MKTNISKTFGALLWVSLISITISVQGQVRISGFIRDKNSGERLIGANISKKDAKTGTVTDNNGFFSLVTNVPCSLRVSYVGYTDEELTIQSRRDTLIEVALVAGKQLNAVEVRGIRVPRSNVASLRISELQQMPSLGAKPDILKSMQLLPGIQSQNEGTSRLLVRGGDPGQNLYLFDNVPVIYVNHLGGFMSVFNPDIINTIDIYKGGFPARFGGRLSSVVDIAQREGDRSALKASFSIGITDASFTVEGPLKLKNANFIVTGRKTLYDAYFLVGTIISGQNNLLAAYGFHDLNGKFSWKPDDRNSFHLNLYQGDDYLNAWSFLKEVNRSQKIHVGNVWGNWLVSGRWNRVISPRVFMTNSVSYSRYRLKNILSYRVSDTTANTSFSRNYFSSVEDLSYRANFKFQLLKYWTADAGLQTSLLTHVPNNTVQSNQTDQPSNEKLNALESALYLDNKIVLMNRIEANLGLRLVNYSTVGFSGFSLEPRVNINIGISEKHQLNLSYMRVTQNSHLLVTTGSIMNNEVWVPADNRIAPALSDQLSVGWNGSFNHDRYQGEISLYYKTMERLATYKEGYTSLMGDADWRSKIIAGGSGRSMGVEFLLRKTFGDWTGFASYSWSHATRQYPEINGGKEYVFEFNRPHTASLNINHKFNEKWAVNLTWVYQTGLPYTPVLGRQYTRDTNPDEYGNYGLYEVLLYGERNSANMRDYHRLDVGVSLNTLSRNNHKATWTFSVYNLYNRHNPYYYYYNTHNQGWFEQSDYLADFKSTNLYQVSFFPIIPSVSYKVYFDKNDPKRMKKPVNERFRKWATQEKVPSGVRNDYLKGRWNIKAGYADYPGWPFERLGSRMSMGDIKVEANYGLLNFLEIGGYLGVGKIYIWNGKNPPEMVFRKINLPEFGLSVNLQLLPLIIKSADFRFDLYLLGRYGGAWNSAPEGFAPAGGLKFQYQHGAGLAFYLSKHVGIFSEYSFEAMDIKHSNLRYGLIVKF